METWKGAEFSAPANIRSASGFRMSVASRLQAFRLPLGALHGSAWRAARLSPAGLAEYIGIARPPPSRLAVRKSDRRGDRRSYDKSPIPTPSHRFLMSRTRRII